jgi:exonuclease SbcD
MSIHVLHFADIHIGMENYGGTDSASGLSRRVIDFVRRLDEMVAYAASHEVHLAVFAGDAFKTRNPNPTYQREFAMRILDLADLCPVVLLVGNHDLPTNARRASTLELYETLRVPNVYVGMDYEVLPIETRAGRVQVATAPYPVKARLLDGLAEGHHRLNITAQDEALQAELHRLLADLARQVADSPDPRLLVGHFTIQGAVTGSEKNIMLGRDVAALLSSVADPAWDYVAMGHIHKFQDLTLSHSHLPPVVYSGSMERIDFGEEGDPKGFIWLELERGAARYQFIPLQGVRPFVTLRPDIRGQSDPTRYVLDLLAKHDLREAVVRLAIEADVESDARLNQRALEEALYQRGANYVAAIQRNVQRPERTRLGPQPESLQPEELLLRYLEHRQVSPERIMQLLDLARDIFNHDTGD